VVLEICKNEKALGVECWNVHMHIKSEEKTHLCNTDEKSCRCIKCIRKLINFSNVNYPYVYAFLRFRIFIKSHRNKACC